MSLAGVLLGFVVHLMAAALGLTALLMAVPLRLRRHPPGRRGLPAVARLAGASSPAAPRRSRRALLPDDPPAKLFSMGFLTNLLNPKVAMFYLSFFPQFLHPERGSVLLQSLVLGAVQIGVSGAVNVVLVLGAAGITAFLSQKRGLAARAALRDGQRAGRAGRAHRAAGAPLTMRFTREEIEAARRTVYAAMPPTPQYAWPLLAQRLGCTVWAKHENHTPAGAFKVRGGLTYFETLAREQPAVRRVISATRGNHGQSVGFAARRHGLAATIVVPHGNSVEKNAAMRALGVTLVEHGDEFQAASEHAAGAGRGEGLHRVPSFHRELVRGVATAYVEFFEALAARRADRRTCCSCRSAWARASRPRPRRARTAACRRGSSAWCRRTRPLTCDSFRAGRRARIAGQHAAGRRHGLPHAGARGAGGAAARGRRRGRGERRGSGRGDARALHRHPQRGRGRRRRRAGGR